MSQRVKKQPKSRLKKVKLIKTVKTTDRKHVKDWLQIKSIKVIKLRKSNEKLRIKMKSKNRFYESAGVNKKQ